MVAAVVGIERQHRSRRALSLAALAIVALALLLGFASPPPAAAGPKPPLSHDGRWFTDSKGRVAVLRGFNMVYKVKSYRPEDSGFGANDARWLRRQGFNSIRLGLIYKGLEPEPPGANGKPRYEEGYLRSIARTEKLLAERKIFTLLDFHQDLYNERFEGEGWPDWQTLDDGLPAEPKNGFPANYVGMPAVSRAFDHFWANDMVEGRTLQDAFADAWRHVATKFRDKPYVMGYDILNEPWPGTPWATCGNPAGCPAFDMGPLSEFSARVLAAIREVDTETLFFWEPHLLFDFGAATSHVDLGDPNAGFSFHDYCLAGALGGPTGDSCEATEDLVFQNAEAVAERTGDVPFLTEYGATDDLETIARMTRLADEHMASWQWWHYCDCEDPTTAGPGIQAVVVDPHKPPRGDNVEREKLELLARPYPQAVNGVPEGWSFDPETRRFELSYVTDPVGGGEIPRRVKTQVAIPRANYGDGYVAKVDGAEIRSRRNRPVLRLKAEPGARRVELTVTPR